MATFDPGNDVQIVVVEQGLLRAVQMEVVKADLRGSKWVYQIKRKGATDLELHTDATGNNWFKDEQLDWWGPN